MDSCIDRFKKIKEESLSLIAFIRIEIETE